MRELLTEITAIVSGSMILSFFGLDGGKGWINFRKIRTKYKKMKVWMVVLILLAVIILSVLAIISIK